MATRARIGIENADGTITSSYHHWDGYPAGLGFKLIQHYNNRDKLAFAISLGDASNWHENVEPVGDHDFDAPQEDVNVYYGRDRGEKDVGPRTFANLDEFSNMYDGAGEEYAYVMRLDGTYTMYGRYDGTCIHDAEDDIVLARAAMISMYRKEAA